MTPADLRKLLDLATRRPWGTASCCADAGHGPAEWGLRLMGPAAPPESRHGRMAEHDARLIAAAVNALPALLAVAEAAMADTGRWSQQSKEVWVPRITAALAELERAK